MIKRDKQRQFLIFVTLTASFLVGCAEDEQEAMPASAQECEVPRESIAWDGSARQRRPTAEEHAALRSEAALERLEYHSLAVEELGRIRDREVRYEIIAPARSWRRRRSMRPNEDFILLEKMGSQVTDILTCSSFDPDHVDLPMTNCASLKDPNRIECVVKQAEDPKLYDYLVESFFPTDVTP